MVNQDRPGGEQYSLAKQGAGIVVVFVASLAGVALSFALNAERLRESESVAVTILFLKGFGCGVVIATAMVHLISEAYEGFEEAGWSELFEAWPMAFALAGIFLLAAADFFTGRLHLQQEDNAKDTSLEEDSRCDFELEDRSKTTGVMRELAATGHSDYDQSDKTRHAASVIEASVISHSLFVGFDLGLQDVDAWRTLVAAIAFHQFFEGVALSQVIVDAGYSSLRKPIVVALCFALTTCVGIAMGMLTRTLADSHEEPLRVMLAISVINSICGGFLLYLGLVSLLVPWFVKNSTLLSSRKLYPVVGFLGVFLGIAGMCIVGVVI